MRTSGTFVAARIGAALALASLAGCSATEMGEEDAPSQGDADSAGFDGGTDDGQESSGASPPDHGSSGGADPGDSDGGFPDGSTGSTGGAFDEPERGAFEGCPDELPKAWIFCEDFEELYDPSEVFFDYQDGEGSFVPTFDGGASGLGAMRARYREGVEGAGFLSVSFGENPINGANRPDYEAEGHFDEIYWRFRVRTQPGWPDVGPHNLTRVSAFAQSDWGQAMVAAIGSNGDDVTLLGSGSSCVEQSTVECSGVDDAAQLKPIGLLQGFAPVFSSERAGQWQCVEVHVRLNTPGQADGAFEFWVDEEIENSNLAVDWRGEWSEFGLNLLSLENFWVGGAPATLDRWFDDLVISTEPIGCGEP